MQKGRRPIFPPSKGMAHVASKIQIWITMRGGKRLIRCLYRGPGSHPIYDNVRDRKGEVS